MTKKSKLTLLVGALLIVGVFLFLGIPQAKANIPSQPFKVWHDREYLGQLEMQKNVYMDAGLFLQGALINGATGGDPIVVGDHMRVDGILYANNIIVRGNSGGDPVIIGDHLRVDGDIFNPYNSVRVKDDFKVSGSSQFSGELKAKKGVAVTGGNLTVGNSTKFKVEYKTGETTISGPLTVTSTSSLKDLTVSGSSSLASLFTSGLATLDSLSVTRSSTFNNSVNVQGNATFYKNVTLGDTAGDTITVAGTANFSNPISGNVSTAGDLSVGGNLNVTGTSVCDTIIFNNLEVSGVPGTTTLKGPMQFGDASADGIDIWGTPTFRTHITVQDDALPSVFQGDLNVNQNLAITQDLAVDTSTLVVDSTNNRVGIGAAVPTTGLDVNLATDFSNGVTVSSGTLSALLDNAILGSDQIIVSRNDASNTQDIQSGTVSISTGVSGDGTVTIDYADFAAAPNVIVSFGEQVSSGVLNVESVVAATATVRVTGCNIISGTVDIQWMAMGDR